MSADTMINVHQPGGLAPVPVLPWDGLWNLDDDAEMLAFLRMLAVRHRYTLFKIGEDWQMGWQSLDKKRIIWGMRLPCPRRAIRDASSRLFGICKGKDEVNGDFPPNPRLPHVKSIDALALAEGWQNKEAH